ncbi:MAG: hypothetical protein Q7V05_10290 [Methanoregula sp.]|nr:hypothetical protein [Methanoregula sp.]
MESADKNQHNTTRLDASGWILSGGIGILHAEICKEITSEVTLPKMALSVGFSNRASIAAMRYTCLYASYRSVKIFSYRFLEQTQVKNNRVNDGNNRQKYRAS